MVCGPKCPCQCVRTKKRRRSHKVLAPRHNPIHDLLSFLIAEKYKEPINKQPIVKPQGIAVGTSTEPSSTETKVEEVLANVQPVAVHEGVQPLKTSTEVESPVLTSQLDTAEAVPVLSSQLSALVKGSSSLSSSRRESISSAKTSGTSDPLAVPLSTYSRASSPPKLTEDGGGGGASNKQAYILAKLYEDIAKRKLLDEQIVEADRRRDVLVAEASSAMSDFAAAHPEITLGKKNKKLSPRLQTITESLQQVADKAVREEAAKGREGEFNVDLGQR